MAQVIRADLDEIVFENREKRYGGYVLRKNYHKYLVFGFLIVLALTALGVIGPYIYSQIQALIEANAPKEVEVDLSKLPPPPPEEKKPDDAPPPPPPPKQEEPPAPPPPVEQVAVKTPVPKPPDEVKEEEKMHEVQELDKGIVSNKDEKGEAPKAENAPIPTNAEPKGTGDAPAAIVEPPKPEPKKEEKKEEAPVDDPYKFIPVSKSPKEVNLSDIQKAIGYPAVAREMNLEETIVFRVKIDENGNYVTHLKPKTGHPILVKAVEEHLSKIKFTPAVQGEKPIPFWVNVPFKFKLQ